MPSEQAACIALLGAAPATAELLVARDGAALVGAAMLVWRNHHAPPGFPLDLHVVPPARRRGIGSRLAAAAASLARGETGALWSVAPLPTDGGGAAFLRACGFGEAERVFHYRIDTARLAEQTARIVERLRAHGRIPAGARAVSLRDAPLAEVAALASDSFGRDPASVMRLFEGGDGGEEGIDLDRSVAVIEDGVVAGAVFGRWNGGECRIEANVVAPAWHNSYVNALLLAQSTANLLSGGSQAFRFTARETAADTLNLARRTGGELLATHALFRQALAA